MLLQNNTVKVKRGAQMSFSGIPIREEKPTGTRINIAKIDTWLANIERQNFILEKKTEQLIGRVIEAERDKNEVIRMEKQSKRLQKVPLDWQKELATLAEKVPTKFQQKYEEQLQQSAKPLQRSDSLLSLSSDDGHTVGQNYAETIEMVKKYIRVEVPKSELLNLDLI